MATVIRNAILKEMKQIPDYLKKISERLHQAKKAYFPKNLRFITEWLEKNFKRVATALKKEHALGWPEKSFWVGVLLGLAVVLIGLLSYQLSLTTKQWLALQHKRAELQIQLKLWEDIAQKYPSYRDAYFEASLIAYQLNNREKAWVLVQKVMQLDPNFAQGKELENRLLSGN